MFVYMHVRFCDLRWFEKCHTYISAVSGIYRGNMQHCFDSYLCRYHNLIDVIRLKIVNGDHSSIQYTWNPLIIHSEFLVLRN